MLPLFPDEFFHMDPPVKLVFNSDDGPRGQVQYDVQQRGEAYGKAGRTWAPAQLEAVEQRQRNTYGWQWTCPPDSPLKQVSISNVLNREHEAGTSQHKSFVGDFYMSMDVCYNPELRDQVSLLRSEHKLTHRTRSPSSTTAWPM
jgi:hypothetical protein